MHACRENETLHHDNIIPHGADTDSNSTVAFVCYPVDPYSNLRPFLALVSEPDPLHREDERSGDVPTFELS